jgi:hypothetical protein
VKLLSISFLVDKWMVFRYLVVPHFLSLSPGACACECVSLSVSNTQQDTLSLIQTNTHTLSHTHSYTHTHIHTNRLSFSIVAWLSMQRRVRFFALRHVTSFRPHRAQSSLLLLCLFQQTFLVCKC